MKNQKEKSFSDQIRLFRAAGFSCINVVTKEEKVAEEEILNALKDHDATGKIFRFSVASALQEISGDGTKMIDGELVEPDELINGIPKFMSNGKGNQTDVLLLPDFTEYLKRDPILRRGLRERIWWARSTGNTIILLSSRKEEIADIENDMTVFHHGLPSAETTENLLVSMANEYGISMSKDEIESCVESLTGMTHVGQSDAVALSLIETGLKEIKPSILQENKEREIAKREYLRIVKPDVSFDDVVGHGELKDWSVLRRNGFSNKAREFGIARPPKGSLLVGPPGTGKTLFAKALTNAWGIPLLQFRIGAIFSSMLGDSEAHVRDAIEVAERMAPCIFWIDEINRAFGGDGGERDGGTQQRITGELLTWMSEKTSPVFVLATANDVTGMPAEMLRKGRFDEIWSVNVPDLESRKNIFELFLSNKQNDVDTNEMAERTDGFIPAEIEEIVNGAHYRAFERWSNSGEGEIITNEDIREELDKIKPLSQTMKDKFDKLKDWAAENARPTTKSVLEPVEPISRKLNS